MGTNYYWHEHPPCEHCGRSHESVHIGKSSGGWCFSLHVYREDGINDLGDWRSHWQIGAIKDEYGQHIDPVEMLNIVTTRSAVIEDQPGGYADWDEFHRQNHSEPGPNGLVRHRIDGRHCVGHGDGTWDLLIGEFS